jgi:hypothetical protein
VCSHNLGYDPLEYIDALRPGSVVQIHLAGRTRMPDFVLDSHVGPVPEPVWDLYRRAVARFGAVPTLVIEQPSNATAQSTVP